MHYDECCSWKISQFPWNEMIDAVSRDAHPPFYYVLMKGLGLLGGSHPAVIRSFSVFFGMATIPAAFWFVSTALADPKGMPDAKHRRKFAAILAALLVAGSALHVEMSVQARPYTLGTFLTLLSATFLVRALPPVRPSLPGDWIGFAVTAALLSLTHYYGLFTVGAELLFAAAVAAAEVCRSQIGATQK
jgi:uncharacterized membrane protein